MKQIAIAVLSLAIVSSGLVQAQQTGQGSAVPRESIVVAQAGTWTSPGSPVVPAPAALPPGFVPMMTIFGLTGLAITASTDTSTNH
jgi:hypothetical protein